MYGVHVEVGWFRLQVTSERRCGRWGVTLNWRPAPPHRGRERTLVPPVCSVMAATLHFHFREHWRELKRGRPGSRFVERYRRARQEDRQRGPWHRVALIAAGVVCLLIAAILTVIPGPAIPFYFLGANRRRAAASHAIRP